MDLRGCSRTEAECVYASWYATPPLACPSCPFNMDGVAGDDCSESSEHANKTCNDCWGNPFEIGLV